MTERQASPSPLAGEGAERKKREAGEGVRSLKKVARKLRSQMTDAERKLWFALRDRRFEAFKFRRQVPIGPYLADFLSADSMQPLTRRLAYARRHPLPQGERGREGPHNEATVDVTLSCRGRGQERGDRAVSRPETPFPRHWRYYIVLKWTVITAAVVIALKLFEAW